MIPAGSEAMGDAVSAVDSEGTVDAEGVASTGDSDIAVASVASTGATVWEAL